MPELLRPIEQAYVGYCAGGSCSGHWATYELGFNGPANFNFNFNVNVNSNCSTGSSALYLAARVIRGGISHCTMALEFEKMQSGSLSLGEDDRVALAWSAH